MGMKFSGMSGVLKSASILSLSLFVLVPSMAHAQAQPKQSDAAAEKGRNTAVAASREIRGLDNNSSNGSTPTPAPAASTPAPAATPAPAPAAGGRAQARNQGSARNASSQSAEQAPARGRSSAREPREYSTMTSRTETPPWNADWQKHRVARIRENYPIVDYTDSVENGGNVVREGYGSKRSAVILNGKRF